MAKTEYKAWSAMTGLESSMKDAGRDFLEYTKYTNMDITDQQRGIPMPPLETQYDITTQKIRLKDITKLDMGKVSFIDLVNNRRSVRKYEDIPMDLDELAYLLWCTQGVKKISGGSSVLRTVPSAGARHAFETYVLVSNVEGLKKGLYRYIALEHMLCPFNLDGDIHLKIAAACLGQTFILTGNAMFIWVAITERMKWRYQERGYRYMFLDAGHVCQNLYLAAESIGCGTCAIGAFDDDEINGIIGTTKDDFVIYGACVGKKVIPNY